ncbi:hypothetical protein DM01DRAFT_1381307 [Hesseltinella vesiculosa]|uniref:Uncharacterized protein n=1 Tax=Hesseltinella vesiculosa TaxID=101127 RepID=A0A1X2GS02_9FUNG|nr:hypothetical protein DM01DRAFT_1381307 [Hesseltinella vesiculosa]
MWFLIVTSLFVTLLTAAPLAPQTWADSNQLAFLNDIIQDDVITHYENMVDDVFSHHREQMLLRLARANHQPEELVSLLAPQANAILQRDPQEVCLEQMPGMIAEQLHQMHNMVFQMVGPTVKQLLPEYLTIDMAQPDKDLPSQLHLLNVAMEDHVSRGLLHARLEHKVALRLLTCELDQQQSEAPHFTTDPNLPLSWFSRLWQSVSPQAHRVKFLYEEQMSLDPTQSFDMPPTLLRDFLDALTDHIHDEWQLRSEDLAQLIQVDLTD